MSEYHAAVGLAELDAWPAKHHAFLGVADTYKTLMHDAGLADRLVAAPEVASCYVLYRTADAHEATCIKEALIGSKVGFFVHGHGDGVHDQPHFHNVSRDALEVTDRIAPMLIGLPVAPDLGAGEVARVVSALELGAGRSR